MVFILLTLWGRFLLRDYGSSKVITTLDQSGRDLYMRVWEYSEKYAKRDDIC